MKKLIVMVLILSGCAAIQPQAEKPKESNYYTFNFNKWQSFIYGDKENTMLLMFQVKDIEKQQIPKEFQIRQADGKVKILELGAAYPEIKKADKK